MNRCWMGYRYAYLVWRCTMHLELMLQIYLTNLILYKSGVNTVNYHNLVLFKQEMHNLAHIIVLDFDILCASPKSSRNLQYINIWENLCKNSKFLKTLHIHLQIIIWIAKKMIGSQLIPFWIQNHWTSKEETNSRICCIIKGYWSCFLISCPSNNEYYHILRPVGSKNLSNHFSNDSNFKINNLCWQKKGGQKLKVIDLKCCLK